MESLLLLGIAGLGAIMAIMAFRASPSLAVACWIAVLFFVPIWIGASAGYYIPAIAAITALCALTATLRGLKWSLVDGSLMLVIALTTMAYALGIGGRGYVLMVLVEWSLPYVWGRLILGVVSYRFVVSSVSIAATAAASLALIEFLTGFNPFILLSRPNSLFSTWGQLRMRGGQIRAEGAFGSSIALGSALAVATAFVLIAPWRTRWRIASLAVIGTAITVTFSRIGLASAVLTVAFCLLLLAREISVRVRRLVLVLLLALTVGVGPLVARVFDASDEADGSAQYRADLLSLVPSMQTLGLSEDFQRLPSGQVYFGTFRSIDSALILTGLTLGWVPLAILIGLMVAAVVAIFRGRATAPLVAVVSQIPTLATVALITQLPYLLWFLVGLTVSCSPGASRHPDNLVDALAIREELTDLRTS